MAVLPFLLEPELFDTYIAFDPSLWWNTQKLVNGAGEHPAALKAFRAVFKPGASK